MTDDVRRVTEANYVGVYTLEDDVDMYLVCACPGETARDPAKFARLCAVFNLECGVVMGNDDCEFVEYMERESTDADDLVEFTVKDAWTCLKPFGR